MTDYTLIQLLSAATKAGFTGTSLVTAAAVSLAENGAMSLRAVNTNNDGSRDRGPWQINDRAHPDVPDSCAFDLQCSANAAYKISNGGTNWQPWTTYTSGAYRNHVSDVERSIADNAPAITQGVSQPGNISGGVPNPFDALKDALQSLERSVLQQLTAEFQIGAGLVIMGAGVLLLALVALKGGKPTVASTALQAGRLADRSLRGRVRRASARRASARHGREATAPSSAQAAAPRRLRAGALTRSQIARDRARLKAASRTRNFKSTPESRARLNRALAANKAFQQQRSAPDNSPPPF